jgi:hypothetical protein
MGFVPRRKEVSLAAGAHRPEPVTGPATATKLLWSGSADRVKVSEGGTYTHQHRKLIFSTRRRWKSAAPPSSPGDRPYPVPDDVVVRAVTAGGVPAHWLAAPGADAGRVLRFQRGAAVLPVPAGPA